MKEFIQINDCRIRKSCIKKYNPDGKLLLKVYYSASRNKIDVEIFRFTTTRARNAALNNLDTYLLK